MEKRVFLIVLDSCGCGEMPDSADFGDAGSNTLRACTTSSKLNIPMLTKMGIFNIDEVGCGTPVAAPVGAYGRMAEKSRGKDTTIGHWEIAGLVSEKPFSTFPNGFPKELVDKFIQETGCKGILANIPASGTAIIEKLNDEHHSTGYPIVYTSADSVFQIAVDTDMIALETLYEWCKIARRLLDEGNYNTARVIARPYKVIDGKPTRISKDRRDYSMEPPEDTVLDKVKKAGAKVIGIGKIEDIFSKAGITHAIHTGSNKEGLQLTIKALDGSLDLEKIKYEGVNITDADREIIFTNLVDTDMLFGHRNNAKGYGEAIEEIDDYLEKILPLIGENDLLIITADHGCDPTVPGTDHTREQVPVLYYSKNIEPKDLGITLGFDSISKRVSDWLF